MELRLVSNFRKPAVTAILNGLSAATDRPAKAQIIVFHLRVDRIVR